METEAKFQMMMAAGMAMALNPYSPRWGEQRRVGGEFRVTAMPDKKTKRKNKQAQQRKNRKK
jgi:hypothetical protein